MKRRASWKRHIPIPLIHLPTFLFWPLVALTLYLKFLPFIISFLRYPLLPTQSSSGIHILLPWEIFRSGIVLGPEKTSKPHVLCSCGICGAERGVKIKAKWNTHHSGGWCLHNHARRAWRMILLVSQPELPFLVSTGWEEWACQEEDTTHERQKGKNSPGYSRGIDSEMWMKELDPGGFGEGY